MTQESQDCVIGIETQPNHIIIGDSCLLRRTKVISSHYVDNWTPLRIKTSPSVTSHRIISCVLLCVCFTSQVYTCPSLKSWKWATVWSYLYGKTSFLYIRILCYFHGRTFHFCFKTRFPFIEHTRLCFDKCIVKNKQKHHEKHISEKRLTTRAEFPA